MHKLVVLISFIVSLLLTCSGSVGAISVSDPPLPPYYSPVFVTGIQVTDWLDALEIYNESSAPVDLSSWSIRYPSVTGETCEVELGNWILPGDYITLIAQNGLTSNLLDNNNNILSYDSCQISLNSNFDVSLYDEESVQEIIKPNNGAYVRKGLTKTYRTGKFITDFIPINRSLFAGQLYVPPETITLQFSEILINSRNCSPLEIAVDCNDYVKVYNPSGSLVDLSHYRIRNGYLGQNPTSSNTIEISGVVEPGHFLVIPMTVTNSASWLWFEDYYGVKVYDNTVLGYSDGSSNTKKGHAWAYDESDGLWKWTTQPMPVDSPSVFPVLLPDPPKLITTTYAPCKEGQYRSEETHRCRSVVSTIASLMPCEAGKVRNPITNRCKSATSVLGTSTLVPCKPGQERNPTTNRCRKIMASAIPKVDYAPKQEDTTSFNGVTFLSIAALGSAAIGYAVWEWRSEILSLIRKLFFKS